MGEVVDEHARFGRLIVLGVKAPRAPLVFSHELTRSVDLGIKRCDSVRDWVHGLLGQFRLPLHSLAKQRTRLPCQKFLRILISGSGLHILPTRPGRHCVEDARLEIRVWPIIALAQDNHSNCAALQSLEQENWRR